MHIITTYRVRFSEFSKAVSCIRMEKDESWNRTDSPWTLVKFERVLNFFIYFYALLKVSLFFCFSYGLL